jgi:glycosyltransferase involved in cell wall biosynthesis
MDFKVMQSKVGILMATYNGERFIKKQIDSILVQTYRNWQLIIHDDGSMDLTVNVIKEYVRKYPDKVIFIEDGIKCGGAKENFAHLMKIARDRFDFDYIMFSDQDDVWLKTKIEKTLKKMIETENSIGRNIPILVHTDLKVVDENLNSLSDSFWKYQNLNPAIKQFSRLLVQNNITGCTVMMNKPLMEKSLPIPKDSIMHDWWLALVASAFGEISFLREPLVLYRQHSCNSIGAKKWSLSTLIDKVINHRDLHLIEKLILQAISFYESYKTTLDDTLLEVLISFISLSEKSYAERLKVVLKYRLLKMGLLRNFGFLYLLKEI